MSGEIHVFLADEAATHALGAALARSAVRGGVVLLYGDLGAGKTTLARGYLRALGHTGAVRSPTYTLLEPYTVADGTVYHLDLYRLAGAEELDYLGLRDLDAPEATWLVEWPERGREALPAVDLEVHLAHEGMARSARLVGLSPGGKAWLGRLGGAWAHAEKGANRHQ